MESGEVNIFPKEWQGVYRQWLENIQDWCISRQLLVGPPASRPGTTKRATVYVARRPKRKLSSRLEKASSLRQDPDVLDTWFSSAMVPLLHPWLA